MNLYQPTLWDSLDLIKGYESLNSFFFDEAEKHFIEASKERIASKTEIQNALHTIHFWKPVIENKEYQDAGVFIDHFNSYQFPSYQTGFKKTILKKLIPALEEDAVSEKWVELFDLACKNQGYDTALELTLRIAKSKPEYYVINYFLGEVHYYFHNFLKSNEYYGKALFYKPDADYIPRIKSNKILELVNKNPLHMVYLYGVITNLFDCIRFPDSFHPVVDKHLQAFNIYKLYLSAEKAYENHDSKLEIHIRKQMQNINPLFLKSFLNFRRGL